MGFGCLKYILNVCNPRGGAYFKDENIEIGTEKLVVMFDAGSITCAMHLLRLN